MPTTIKTTILEVTRLPSSRPSGNPRYQVRTPVGTWPTKPDCGDAYALTAGQAAIGATLTLDGRGHIYGIELDR